LQYTIQGRFKQNIPFASLYTGQIFQDPLKKLPSRWLLSSLLTMIAILQPGLKLKLDGDRPYALSALVSTLQNIGMMMMMMMMMMM
jgi:hypothetical protein